MREIDTTAADVLLREFAARTGVGGLGDSTKRYLWTDAYAVLASLGLARRTGAPEHLGRALRIVDLVHHVLGRHRPDDARTGWISGLEESDGERRPTAGGLRIGKPLPERGPREPIDERLEWERDGQYFHYLTKWMHALNAVARATHDPRWNAFAIDLASAAHKAFVSESTATAPRRMCWKMSIDLSRPLVRSMGHLDPLDGFVAFSEVRAIERRLRPRPAEPSPELELAIRDMRTMCDGVTLWATTDALGIGGLLVEAGHLAELIATGDLPFDELLPRLLTDAERSLEAIVSRRELWGPVETRLAFRELGLSLGLRSIGLLHTAIKSHPERFGGEAHVGALLTHVEALESYTAMGERIEDTWLSPAAQATVGWMEHQDINSVMLAASLVSEAGCLEGGDESVAAPGRAVGV